MTLTVSGGTVYRRVSLNPNTSDYDDISTNLIPFVTSTVAQPHTNCPTKGLGKFVNYQDLVGGEIKEPFGGPASRGGILPSSNLKSSGLDATTFDPNDENDPIFQ